MEKMAFVSESYGVNVREFDGVRDVEQVERLERRCEVGPSGKVSLFTDLMGDPICRVRHCPAYAMLVRYFFIFLSGCNVPEHSFQLLAWISFALTESYYYLAL